MDETLIQHCNLQRNVGKRFPFKGYTTSKKIESKVMDRTKNASTLTEESIFESIANSSYETIRKESGDTLRVLTSSFIIGKEAVIQFVQGYVEDLKHLEEELKASSLSQSQLFSSVSEILQYLPFIVHLVIYLDDVLQSSQAIHQAAQVLILKYMQTFLQPTPSLWRCMALYTSLISDEKVQMEKYKDFLKCVKKRSTRKNMLLQASSLFPTGMDLNNIKLLLDETYVHLDLQDGGKMEEKEMKVRMDMIQWTLFFEEHRLDAIWYANIFLRQVLLQMKNDNGKLLAYAQEFLESHFPRDSIDIVHKYYNEKNILSNMDDEEAESIIQEIHNVTEEHESLCLFADANTAYEHWRLCLTQSTSEIEKAFSEKALPSYLQNDKKHKLNSTELEIANQVQKRELIKKVNAATEKVIELAYETETLLQTILEYPGGWLVRSSVTDENHQTELDELRKICLPRVVHLLRNLCVEMGDWMESISLEGENESLFKDVENKEVFSPEYWYRKALNIAKIVAQEEHQIHQTFSNEEMKLFLHSMKETGLRTRNLSNRT